MPGDATHVKWAQYVVSIGGVALYALGVDLLHIIGMAWLFMFGTKYVSPDLDINSKPYQRWGVLRVMFYPFMKLVPHRSKWSHHIIIGPIIVVSYFMGLVLVGCLILNRFWLPVVEPMIDRAQEILNQIMTLSLTANNATILGVCAGCLFAAVMFHNIVDKVLSGDRMEQ